MERWSRLGLNSNDIVASLDGAQTGRIRETDTSGSEFQLCKDEFDSRAEEKVEGTRREGSRAHLMIDPFPPVVLLLNLPSDQSEI